MKDNRLARVLTLLLVAVAVLPASCHRSPRFGYDFEQDSALDDFTWRCRTLYQLSTEHATSGAKSLRVMFFPAPDWEPENYPGVSFTRFDPDWSLHGTLVFDAYNPGETAVRLGLRIDDRKAPEAPDRFNRALELAPGDTHVSIPLEQLVASGTKRVLDRNRIQEVMFFVSRPLELQTLYLDRIRLE